ncbi:MAG TPA: glycerol kinase GlpK [Candidatus Methylomirabilis sp.]|nr:glycerol kinase GlpK [Candidatus Methylomirabilis sp.]
MDTYILALDQGTTSSRAILFDRKATIVAVAQREFRQIFPRPGWVEHDPLEIWESQLGVAREAVASAGIAASQIAAVGITNQRETTIVWDRATGAPVHNAIVWQCRRSAPLCDALKARGLESAVRARTGLVIDAYFSGTKIQWLLENVPGLRDRAERGAVCFGTVDTWLTWRLSGGKAWVTDYSNASRTMLFNIHKLSWDPDLLAALGVPRTMLPEVRPSSAIYAHSVPDLLGAEIPIAGIAGDQQASLFGQACFQPGMAKNTYGTGCFLLVHTGDRPVPSQTGLLTTIAASPVEGRAEYALEGSIFITGAAIQWLRDGLGLIATSAESEAVAVSVPDTGGVYFVPAFVGLGAPHWDMYARGTLLGITRGTTRAHLVRAALEAIAFQTREVLGAAEADAGLRLQELRVDGGATSNNLLMQFQADVLGTPVVRPVVKETTALGAAYLAGLAVGYWKNREEIARNWAVDRRFLPVMDAARREELFAGWRRAVARSAGWALPPERASLPGLT